MSKNKIITMIKLVERVKLKPIENLENHHQRNQVV